MHSLDIRFHSKREHKFRSSSLNGADKHPFLQRPRSRFPRFLISKKLDYLQWTCTVIVFLFFVALFQIFLPSSVLEKSEDVLISGDLTSLEDAFGLDIQEHEYNPLKFFSKFKENTSYRSSRTRVRFSSRKPQLAMVFSGLMSDFRRKLMVTVAAALKDIGYELQVYSLEDGAVHDLCRTLAITVKILGINEHDYIVDWMKYDGIMINSIEAWIYFENLMVEPFKNLPIIWTIDEEPLKTSRSGNWKTLFERSTVVAFPSYELMKRYSAFDPGKSGNFIILGEECRMSSRKESNLRERLGYTASAIVIAIVRSRVVYQGIWHEHLLVLDALKPIVAVLQNSIAKIVVITGDSSRNCSNSVKMIARGLGYADNVVNHVSVDDDDAEEFLSVSDVVIYGSYVDDDEILFPDVLAQALCLQKVILAPDLSAIKEHVEDKISAYLFKKQNVEDITKILLRIISNGNLSSEALKVASIGKTIANDVNVIGAIHGYALVLENVIQFPSEVSLPKAVSAIDSSLKSKWRWDLFERFADLQEIGESSRSIGISLDEWGRRRVDRGAGSDDDDTFIYDVWEEEKLSQITKMRRLTEEEEMMDRSDQAHGTWEEVYRSAKRADRLKTDLHERDERELERTGQPLCIYEPYLGEGAWPFLHQSPLYRGIGLSTRGRRPGEDDIDAASRLPILNDSYYRDALGEYGAFFAVANRIDRVHKNPWIGFQSWRAASLSESAANAVINAIESGTHGDVFYFWIRMDNDSRCSHRLDFWSFCDSINAGNCRFAFSEAMKKMYGFMENLLSAPPMPEEGGTWSVMQSWTMPTRSYLEFVMFSRMFVDALDTQFPRTGYCYLSMYKDRHCYSRVLELLVNVWAYHSARRMIYVDPETGAMEEQHGLSGRRGRMWIRWFIYSTLKGMDEDLAEEWDLDRPSGTWLWPLTGEVMWQGLYDRERNIRLMEKEKRRQKSKDKISRMRGRSRQKVLGKYVKPGPDVSGGSNSTRVVESALR